MTITEAKHLAKREADAVLESIWQAIYTTSYFPVDPVRLAKELGIDIFAGQLERVVSGALIKEPGRDPVIILNKEDSPVRQRFTAAHELGHYIRRAGDDADYTYVDLRDDIAKQGTEPEEVFANAFAACLLMPEVAVREERDERRQLSELAFHFGVSQEAMRFRLDNLSLKLR